MDSEDSRPGSSASNSSSSSSQASRQSPNPYNDQTYETKSHNTGASPTSSSGSRRSRRSGSVFEGSQNSRSKSKSDSDTSSNTSLSDEGEDDETKSSNNVQPEKKTCSENGKTVDSKENLSTSASPMSHRSSRDSSLSSNRSRSVSGERQQHHNEININHDDLSDVSDLDSEKRSSASKTKLSVEDTNSVDEKTIEGVNEFVDNEQNITDLRQKLEKKKHQMNEKCDASPSRDAEKTLANEKIEESLEDLVKPHDEDALDFEAEEGECQETGKTDDINNKQSENDKNATDASNKLSNNNEAKDDEELEEGEVTDEDEKRPEETEPKPVCRFYTRGQCTWGMSCRFLHPGVTDKGNYTMFDLIRPVPLPQSGSTVGSRPSNYIHAADFHDYRSERPTIHHRPATLHHTPSVYPASTEARKVILDGPVVVESAWERGLRTAKEMMRKANKRKEQDMDFEDKKMNLTLSPDELEKDPYYLKDRLTPTEPTRHPLYENAAEVYNATERYGRGPPVHHYDEVDPYGRSTRYRELPPHRMPHYEDERRVRPTREVIVQRVEPLGRGDDWNDPWMRSKSPNGRGGSREHGDKRRRERRSYSSNSSYTSSSSSQSDSSSESSRSMSPRDRHRRRYNSNSHKVSPTLTRRTSARNMRSLTPPPRKGRGTSGLRQSPNFKRRTHVSPSAYNRGVYSPVHKRKRLSPLSKQIRSDKSKLKRTHSSSSSDSDSTGSESETDSGSSSSESSSQSQDRTPPKRRVSDKLLHNERKFPKKDVPKKRSPITIELKKPTTVGISALTSPSHVAPIEKDSKKSRREELLKQLRAVEDAIAKKRSKLA